MVSFLNVTYSIFVVTYKLDSWAGYVIIKQTIISRQLVYYLLCYPNIHLETSNKYESIPIWITNQIGEHSYEA